MDISKEMATGSEGNASIRLRYSTQVQGSGRTHTIDAEISLPIGASQEMREQIIREAELGVEQLARQIAQRSSRSSEGPRSQAPTPLRPAPEGSGSSTLPATSRPGGTPRLQNETTGQSAARQATETSIPPSRAPIGESMPPASVPSGEGRTIKLADFIGAIHKHLDLSPKEAMELLNVKTLDGLNYKDAFAQLRKLVDAKNASGSQTETSARTAQTPSGAEASRQTSKATQPIVVPRAPLNQAPNTTSSIRTQGQAAVSEMTRPTSQAAPPAVETTSQSRTQSRQSREAQPVRDSASSPKAPIPIHHGVEVVSESAARAYAFDEEEIEDEEFEENEDEDEEFEEDYRPSRNRDEERASAHLKLDRLKSIRGNQPASADRLKVLDTLVASQISQEQLQKIIHAAWGATNKKRLKNAQLEELISWAKEDLFVEEAAKLLNLIEEGQV